MNLNVFLMLDFFSLITNERKEKFEIFKNRKTPRNNLRPFKNEYIFFDTFSEGIEFLFFRIFRTY
jgi:hypothetical protein